ncbi:MAG: DNA integrity scanning protein DisA nucleotide-binding domain protein, partial [Deltaproteobacteria bacterium]|nr:DNA integrity scanning protein DisA nucleotide-binding domain protein [Deltaproteobacteria bacterium]
MQYDLILFLNSIRWQDVVDITLNSYILFRLYVLFRGTNVVRVLAGITLLWIFQRIAASIGLIVTSLAFQGIIAFAALIIIIVFKNEIRSVLQTKNVKTILWGLHYKTIKTPIEILVESIYELSRRRCGALLVFPAAEDLKEFTQRGITWHGQISGEMILSIFWHDNPVHDGAAIIKGDRITEVGVILPLSKRKDLPSCYGTRHRAAAGLAEQTDALVIVVSEERGKVVVAKGDRIIDIHDNLELEQTLKDHVGMSTKHILSRKKENFRLGWAAVLAFFFVSGIWFSFARGLETLVTLEIPVEYMNRSPQMQILETSINDVSLNLRGSGTLIKSLRPEQVNVRLDLSKAVVGSNTFTITPENITLPPGVLLNKVTPPVIKVTLDVSIEKNLPIQADWIGKLPEG